MVSSNVSLIQHELRASVFRHLSHTLSEGQNIKELYIYIDACNDCKTLMKRRSNIGNIENMSESQRQADYHQSYTWQYIDMRSVYVH
jgi:hypothetical protein